jgi:hypothetical protein
VTDLNCYYTGNVKGYPDSIVAFNLKGTKVEGYLLINQTYHLHLYSLDSNQFARSFLPEDFVKWKCSVNHTLHQMVKRGEQVDFAKRDLGQVVYIDITIVNDYYR